jgi:hypothetical protein
MKELRESGECMAACSHCVEDTLKKLQHIREKGYFRRKFSKEIESIILDSLDDIVLGIDGGVYEFGEITDKLPNCKTPDEVRALFQRFGR